MSERMKQLLQDACDYCAGHGYVVVAGKKKECRECGAQAQAALLLEAAQ